MNLDFWLRAMTILVFIIVRVYWYKAKYKFNLEKHKHQNKSLLIEKIGRFMIAVTGAFIVAKTYLFIPLFFFQLILMTNFAKREERLLGSYFGKEYIIYMQKTKMFIPFIF